MNTFIKDFDEWNTKQKLIDAQDQHVSSFYEREVWWASLGLNIGREMDGKGKDYARPVLIIRKFSADTLWVIPITTTQKTGSYFHAFTIRDNMKTASLLQMRMISAKRLLKKTGRITVFEFNLIIQKMHGLLPKRQISL